MVEKINHKLLVEKAKKYLLFLGFSEDEIIYEYKINKYPDNEYSSECYFVDIAGVKKDKLVLIECGSTNNEKLNFLRSKGELYILKDNFENPIKMEDERSIKSGLNYKPVCISIPEYQSEFIRNQSRDFKLSRFVQGKLDDYMHFRKDFKKFMEVENEKTTK
jgi:hypothetical protein